jgi:hypothetical protein
LESWQKKYFKQVSVATPASRVAGGGGYVTLVNDKIIALLAMTEKNRLQHLQ